MGSRQWVLLSESRMVSALQVTDMTKRFGPVVALDDVSLTVGRHFSRTARGEWVRQEHPGQVRGGYCCRIGEWYLWMGVEQAISNRACACVGIGMCDQPSPSSRV